MRKVAVVGAGMTAFGEHFGLGIKDLLPMAYSEAVSHVDKGIDKSEIQAAYFGELTTTDGFPAGILADTLDLTEIPITRIENACATGNDAVRNGMLAIASGAYDVVLVVGADKVRETATNTTFWEWAALTRDVAWDYPLGLVAPANFALHVSRYLHETPATRGAPGDGGGQEPFPRPEQPEGSAALRDHRRAGTGRPDGGRPVRALPTAPRRVTARPPSSWPPRMSSTATPTGRSGYAGSASAWIASCTGRRRT